MSLTGPDSSCLNPIEKTFLHPHLFFNEPIAKILSFLLLGAILLNTQMWFFTKF